MGENVRLYYHNKIRDVVLLNSCWGFLPGLKHFRDIHCFFL